MRYIRKLGPLLRAQVVRDIGLGVIMGFIILTALSAQIIWEAM